jgi:hypothetical protein
MDSRDVEWVRQIVIAVITRRWSSLPSGTCVCHDPLSSSGVICARDENVLIKSPLWTIEDAGQDASGNIWHTQ